MISSRRLPQRAKCSVLPTLWARFTNRLVNSRRLLSGIIDISTLPASFLTHLPRLQRTWSWVNLLSSPMTTGQRHQQPGQVLQSIYPPALHSTWPLPREDTGSLAQRWQWREAILLLPNVTYKKQLPPTASPTVRATSVQPCLNSATWPRNAGSWSTRWNCMQKRLARLRPRMPTTSPPHPTIISPIIASSPASSNPPSHPLPKATKRPEPTHL